MAFDYENRFYPTTSKTQTLALWGFAELFNNIDPQQIYNYAIKAGFVKTSKRHNRTWLTKGSVEILIPTNGLEVPQTLETLAIMKKITVPQLLKEMNLTNLPF